MKKIWIITCSLCLLMLVFSGISSAATYKYLDKYGNVCFADDLQSIPTPYRKSAVLIEGEAKEEKPSPPGRYSGRLPETQAPEKNDAEEAPSALEVPSVPAVVAGTPVAGRSGMTFSIRLAISFGVIIAAMVLLAVVNRLPAMKDNRYGKVVARSSFVMVVLVYLLVMHAKDLMLMFGLAGKTLDRMQYQSAEKGRKAAEAIKKLDALVEEMNRAEEEMNRAESGANK